MKILHIDSESTWRGGQNQTKLLIEGLLEEGHEVFLAARPDSAISHAMENIVPVLEIPMQTISQWRSGKVLGAYCCENGIDIIDAQSSKAHGLGLRALPSAKFAKLVVHRRVDYWPSKTRSLT